MEGVGSQGNIGVGYSAGKTDGEICADSHKLGEGKGMVPTSSFVSGEI